MKAKQRTNNFKRSTIRRLIVAGALLLLFVILYLLTLNQSVCEFFSTTISRWWITAFGTLLGWIPFSLYEMLLIVAILGSIAFVVIEIALMCKHKWQKCLTALLIVVICVLSFLNIYTVSASFAYNRNPLPTSVYQEFSGEDFSAEEAYKLAKYLVEETSRLYDQTEHDANGMIVYPYNIKEMSDLLAEEFKRLDKDYFSAYTPHGKWVLNKTIMSELGITGVFFAPFGEANVNGIETGIYMPITLAHELSHGKGVMKEYQADLVAYYVLMTSSDPYLRYGATSSMSYRAINLLSLYPNTKDRVNELYEMMDQRVVRERMKESSKWSQYDTLDKIGEFFNDLYLKLQKQEGGTDSYYKPGEVVETGEKDDDERPIQQVIRFSDMQNLLITLYKQGVFVQMDAAHNSL